MSEDNKVVTDVNFQIRGLRQEITMLWNMVKLLAGHLNISLVEDILTNEKTYMVVGNKKQEADHER